MRGERSEGAMADLNGHEAGNGGYSQGTPTAPWALLYSERWGFLCAGINRHEAEEEEASRERTSDPLGAEFCVGYREVHDEA